MNLVAVGDVLMHQDVQRSARQTGSFEALWAEPAPLFTQADLAFANLETPVAPASGVRGRPFVFNAPEELPGALKRSGFAVVATANNHAYDQGPEGVTETLKRLDAAGLIAVGSGGDQSSAETPRVLVRKGLRIAFLAYTDVFNNDLNQPGKGPWVNPLDEDRVVESARRARLQADVVIASLHWGIEYQHNPSERQREVAKRLLDAGVDLIIGHHPHVLQPMEVEERAGHPVAVAYSLGNFISNQDRMFRPTGPVAEGDSRDGMALTATFVMQVGLDGSRRANLEKVSYVPLWTINNWQEIQVGISRSRDIRVLRTASLAEPLRTQRLERIKDVAGDRMEPVK